jgi:uncharacterized protein YjbI with pentapeptide repeats
MEPRIPDDPLYKLLRAGAVDEFNAHRARGAECDLRDCNFRDVDLKGLDAAGLDLSGCYSRQADLRGVDFSATNLAGASIHGALVPRDLSAPEIQVALQFGTRLRTRG